MRLGKQNVQISKTLSSNMSAGNVFYRFDIDVWRVREATIV